MKAIVFAFALFAIFGFTSAEFTACLHHVNLTAFNLCPFSKAGKEFTKSISGDSRVLTFGLGSDHIKSCESDKKTVWAKVENSADSLCSNLATKDPSFSLLDATNATEGIRITFPPEPISEGAYNHLVYEVGCDMSKTIINQTEFHIDRTWSGMNYTYTIKGKSRFGCPALSFEQVVDFIANNKVVFAAVFGVIGLILTFFGLKFVNFTIFSITATAGTMISGMFLYQFTDVTTTQWVFWALLFVCVVLGLVLGYVALKLEKVAIFFVGGLLGFVGGDLLYMTIIKNMIKDPSNPHYFIGVVVVCVLIGGTLAFLLFETVLILATSFIGSYMLVRVASMFIGHFPAEISVSQGATQFDGWAYGYFAIILTIALAGIKVQWSMYKNNKEEIEDIEKGNDTKSKLIY